MANNGELIFQMCMELMQSDSSSDDEVYVQELLMAEEIKENKVLQYIAEIQHFTDNEFKNHFRIRRDTFYYILHHISNYLENDEPHCGRPSLPAEAQFLIALWCMGTPDSYRSVATRFGISKGTAWRTVRKVCQALYNIRTAFIVWPDINETQEISDFIEDRHSFPNVIGAIDGTHIYIPAPRINPEAYVNRKGRHSIQLQIVCDHKLRIRHCYCGQVGSVHDQRVLRLSDLQDFFCDNFFPRNTHLLGDSAYRIQKHLLVPYRDNGHLTQAQINYNNKLSSARMMVERTFGLLKGRWRSLLDKLPICRTDFIPQYVVACCILHNMCLLRDDEIEIPFCVQEEEHNIRPEVINNVNGGEGVEKRINITNALLL